MFTFFCDNTGMPTEIVSSDTEIAELKKTNAGLTELISMTSHQLRTSLSAVKWILKMLQDGDYGELSKEQKEMITEAYGANDRMIRLISDVLSVSHLDSPDTAYK